MHPKHTTRQLDQSGMIRVGPSSFVDISGLVRIVLGGFLCVHIHHMRGPRDPVACVISDFFQLKDFPRAHRRAFCVKLYQLFGISTWHTGQT